MTPVHGKYCNVFFHVMPGGLPDLTRKCSCGFRDTPQDDTVEPLRMDENDFLRTMGIKPEDGK